MSETMESLLSRASVTELVEPAPRGQVLARILSTGLRAPDHGKLRPWRWVVIDGAGMEDFATLAVRAHAARDLDARGAELDRTRAKALRAPMAILLGGRILADNKIPEIEQVMSVAAGAMNLLNALHAEGFGGVWITGAYTADPAIAAGVGFEAPERLFGVLFVGTPEDGFRAPPRPELDPFVRHWPPHRAPSAGLSD